MNYLILILLITGLCATRLTGYVFPKMQKSLYNDISLRALDYNDLAANSILFSLSADYSRIFSTALTRAVDGGVAGASASAVQVVSLMWLRTAMNYQYQYGNSTFNALQTLYNDGGIPRLYQGLSFALIQGPLSRFGDTATNALVLTLVESLDTSSNIPLPIRTAFGSVAAGIWRIFLMPIDTVKTSLQVNGKTGLDLLKIKINEKGIQTLYSGSVASAAATMVGHFPWFFVYNSLSTSLPTAEMITSSSVVDDPSVGASIALVSFLSHTDARLLDLARSAFIGLCASSTSDLCSNSLRVLKTYRQTTTSDDSYILIAKKVIAQDGWTGLFGRGLQTRLLSNALQGMLFSVLWKYFQKLYASS